MKYTSNLLLHSFHKDWHICQRKLGDLDIILDYYDGDPDVLPRCTFIFRPTAQNENRFRWCTNVVGPVNKPFISGQPLPHPPHLVSHTTPQPPALPSCIPVCPAGTWGGAPEQPTSVGPSTPIIPSPPEVSLGPSFLPRRCSRLF